ncbi:YjgN family protein [Flavobacterium sp. PL002]|uniref:YjgN family protein n=1 Tax=Flavobacterium sp. PL002 TaxID=1897058 RepID=UPI00178792B2|nr:YjgN family protein [Flavobacterium sp. PL002]MBE0390572.1 Inner membrane protein YjgN [Flavobacterium sp. PL002]
MEDFLPKKMTYNLDFKGKGGDFFGIVIINWLLTIVTLGIYYPWAKAKTLQFIFGQTTLNEDSFAFHGTGKEMFKGFIKAIGLFFCLALIMGVLFYLQMPILGGVFFYLGIIAILPVAIHGSYRYRMSRTSWRGIRFGYRGDRKEFTLLFFKWIFFTIITFGIYGSWLKINLRNYVLSNVRFGDAELNYDGDGRDYFFLNFKGYFLSVITLGIYMFWWQKDIFNYYIDNLSLYKDDKKITFTSTATGGDFVGLVVINLLIIIFTLGFGYAWVVTRTIKFIFDHIKLEGNIDLDTLQQTEANFKDATGDDISDFLDIDFIV